MYRKKSLQKAVSAFRYFLWIIPFILLGIFYVWQHIEIVKSGYSINKLKSERIKLVEENRILQLNAASLRSPQRIESMAKGMGLVSSKRWCIVRLYSPRNL
ncbi:cell division protein FtsL [bacterium]|nr:cell division protein FtsL [bacterium]